MAAVPQVGSEGQVFQSIVSSGMIPARYRPEGIDNLGILGFITRGTTKFLNMIHQRNPKSRTVNERTFKIQELRELDRVLDVTVDSAAGTNHTVIGLSNNQANHLIVNDMVYISGLFVTVKSAPLQGGQVYAANTLGYTPNTQPASNIPPALNYPVGNWGISVAFSGTFGQSQSDTTLFFKNWEPCLVVDIGAPDSASTGNTNVTLQRCYMSSGIGDEGGSLIATSTVTTGVNTGDAGMIKAGTHQLLRGLPNFPEGGDAPEGMYKNPYMESNFCQESKYAIEATKESIAERSRMTKSHIEITKMLRGRQLALDQEHTWLFGRKGATADRKGNRSYTTGGVIEHVPEDTDHILTYQDPTLTLPGMYRIIDQMSRNGGSEERDFFCGQDLHTALLIMFMDKGYLRLNTEASMDFGMEIHSFSGGALKLNIIPCYTLTEAKWGNRALVLDNMSGSYSPVTFEGYDMKITPNIQNPGTEIYKEQTIIIKGLERRYSQYQHIVNFNI